MNINYGDDNLIVQYLQYFLRDYCDRTVRMSGIFDQYTHKKLLEYLDMPNIKDSSSLIEELQNITIDLSSIEQSSSVRAPLETPFKMMQVFAEDDAIVFLFKNPLSVKGHNVVTYDVDKEQFTRFSLLIPVLRRVYDTVYDIVSASGWKIADYPSMYSNTDIVNEQLIKDVDSITVVLQHKTPSDMFPHHDMRYMVNYFQNEYINNIEVSNSFFRKSSKYRIALVNCRPGDVFVISHGYTYSVPIKVGFSTETINDIKDIVYTNNNGASLTLHKMNEISEASQGNWKFIPGTPMLIRVPIDYNNKYQTMVIQLPYLRYNKQLDITTQTPLSYVDISLKVGDINNDGIVDEIDRLILASQRPNEAGSYEGTFYFNEGYSRYKQLTECIENKYENLFFYSNINSSTFKPYNHKYIRDKNSKANIDILVDHLRLLCSGSDVEFQRYLINNEINYKIVVNSKGLVNKNLTVLNSSDYRVTVGEFDAYLSGKENEILDSYIYDDKSSSIGFSITKTNNVGVKIICGSNMSSNNLLIIKTNPKDDVNNSDKIVAGVNNNDNNLSLILPVQDFKDDPWIIRKEFISAMLDNMTNPYSDQEDIAYIYSLAEADVYSNLLGVFGNDKYIFTDSLRLYLKTLQNRVNSAFALGYFDATAYRVMFSSAYNNYINEIDRVMGVE